MKFFLRRLSSLKITVGCLLWLFVLTFWGTVAQTQVGLYLAQEKFFNSLFFLEGGFLPFPGARLVIWVLFLNLAAVTITRFVKYRKWKFVGILITHFGLLFYFLGAFVTFHSTVESSVTLLEQAGTNLSESYVEFEVSLWRGRDSNPRGVSAVDLNRLTLGKAVVLDGELGFELKPLQVVHNAALQAVPGLPTDILNASGGNFLFEKPFDKERERNLAGLVAEISVKGQNPLKILLYAGEPNPLVVTLSGQKFNIQLRRRQYVLPFTIQLDDFRANFHPGTEMARAYESDVVIDDGHLKRKALISMNEPFRYGDFTVFQAAYRIDDLKREYSTFAVVKNKGRYIPYISSLLVFLGLTVHFVIEGLTRKRHE